MIYIYIYIHHIIYTYTSIAIDAQDNNKRSIICPCAAPLNGRSTRPIGVPRTRPRPASPWHRWHLPPPLPGSAKPCRGGDDADRKNMHTLHCITYII